MSGFKLTPPNPTPPMTNSSRSSPEASTSGTRLEVKRIDKACVEGEWEIFDNFKPVLENSKKRYAEYAEYALILRRKVQQIPGEANPKIVTKILIQNDDLLRITKDVMKDVRKLSWNLKPCKIDPELLLAFLAQFKAYLSRSVSTGDDCTVEPLSLMINLLETEYASRLSTIDSLVSNGEITFDLLWAVFLPRSVLFTSCKVTSEPRAVRLLEIYRTMGRDCVPYWNMICEYIDANDLDESESQHERFDVATMELTIKKFDGVVKVADLSTYPLEWHPRNEELRQKFIKRGRKWVDLHGVHHLHYNGMAYRQEGYNENYTKVTVNGRVMIDRRTFADMNPNYGGPSGRERFLDDMFGSYGLDARDLGTVSLATTTEQVQELEDDDLLLTSPILYGFSLIDKQWLEFDIERVSTITWNDNIFANVAIDSDLKALVRSLVESHAKENSFDDFVEGKGLGLVFNLFGPPGVGKSLTVEATSEHLRKPFYVVGAGDLGTGSSTLDTKLTDIFQVAAKWKAVVLIDEADVFLEERGIDNLERNAMVAVFLRQIEYFRGILFLTTNRVRTFDPAFQSRIHLSLQYKDLSSSAKKQIWRAFLVKARGSNLYGVEEPTVGEMRELSEKNLNGRQIKNVIKLSAALAGHEKRPLGFKHLIQMMDLMGRSVL